MKQTYPFINIVKPLLIRIQCMIQKLYRIIIVYLLPLKTIDILLQLRTNLSDLSYRQATHFSYSKSTNTETRT